VASIQESKILSIKGPYPAGMPDISVFKLRDGVLSLIPANKRLIGDKGYQGVSSKIAIPSENDSFEVASFKPRALAHHETLNSRLKGFNALMTKFRHFQSKNYKADDFEDHKNVFDSICVLVQYDLVYNTLFE
jgi:hypothetical protein